MYCNENFLFVLDKWGRVSFAKEISVLLMLYFLRLPLFLFLQALCH